MAEITAGTTPAQPGEQQLTQEQIEGRACRKCASTKAPLHPNELIVTHPFEDVIRETVSVLCTPCLVTSR